MKKASPHHSESQPTNSQAKFSTNLAAQRKRLLEALRLDSLTTLQIRHDLDILHPAGRVMELRALGYNIVMTWVYEETEAGRRHRVGKYSLLAGTWKGNAA